MALATITDGFIASEEIIVFPCANRGTVSNAAYSQLLTEYNLTHTNGIIGNFDSYVIDNSNSFNDGVQFKAVIGGYLFIIPNGFNTTTYKYIGIIVSSEETGRLQKINISESGGTVTIYGSNEILDAKVDNEYIFYGAKFLTETEKSQMTSNPFSYILDITNDTSAIARYNSTNSQLILN